MATRKLPSLNALRAFEASARHSSFTLAAQELHVTQGAISHQIKALEEELGLPLFERLPNQLRLTRSGQSYLEVIRDAFDRIERATGNLHAPRRHECLAISASPNFSAKWLVPRLGDFNRQHPAFSLRLAQSEHHVNFIREDIDVAIRYGVGPWPGLVCTRLGDEFLLPVCAPALAAMHGAADVTDMGALPLLHLHDQQAWTDWFAEKNQAAPSWPGMVFNHESAAIDAAVAGQGMALARSSLVALALRQATLIAPLPSVTALAQAYWLVYPDDRQSDDKMTAFTGWLQDAFREDRQFLADMMAHAQV